MKKLLLGLLLFSGAIFAQTKVTPDCVIPFSFTATGSTSNATCGAPNGAPNGNGIASWVFVYYSTGYSALSIVVQSAPDSAGTPGSWGTFAGTVLTTTQYPGSSGANPNTATSSANVALAGYFPWMRVTLSSVTGTGKVTGALYGFYNSTLAKNGGGGGGGGNLTIAGTPNQISVAGAGCTPTNSGTCTISIPTNPIFNGVATAGGFVSSEAFSGALGLNGLTSGNVSLVVGDIAGTAIAYILPTTNGMAGQFLEDSGSTTCPTLPSGFPTTCHQTIWATPGAGGFAVQVNGTPLTGLTTLNFAAGSNITLTPTGSGTYTLTIASTGGATGGATNGYSAPAVTLPTAGTTFIPPVGGGLPSSTEANVQWVAPVTATLSQMSVVLSAVPGTGNTVAFTFRDGGSSQTVTCTITAAIKTCTDSTHSFSVTAGDLLDIQIVTTGTVVAAPNVQIGFQYGGGGSGGGGNKTTFGAYPSFPGTPASGDLFFANNSPHMFSWNGSAWLPYSLWSGIPLTSFVNSGFTWVNQDNAAVAAADVDFNFTITNPSSGSDEIHNYQSGTTLTIPYTYTVHFMMPQSIGPTNGNNGVGIIVKDTISGHLISHQYFYINNNGGSNGNIIASDWNTETSNNGLIFQAGNSQGGVAQSGIWLRIQNDGTNRLFSWSMNGVDYFLGGSQTAGQFLTENAAGVGFYTINNNVTMTARLDSYKITNP